MSHINEKSNAVQNQAFTLIELLVVIAIIVILVGIITPSVRKALLLAKRADAAAYLSSVSNAILQYKTDNAVFPGQDRTDDIGTAGDQLSGSQMLAVCLLTGLNIDTPITGKDPHETDSPANIKSNYIDYKAGETTKDDIKIKTAGDRKYTLTDMWKSADDPRALLYYPSRIGNTGTITNAGGNIPAFVYEDNEDYCTGSDPDYTETEARFQNAIEDTRFGSNKAYNADTFILIGPSIDRNYFGDDNNENSGNDDVMNFNE